MRSELAWREFYADVLWHRPDSARRPLQIFGNHLRWDTGERARDRFRAWATGQTGYPLVDAGMRQLLAEGWMHNRVRMVAASFLVKDLHIDWRLGARWFMWHLVDGDLASNQQNWQWVAGIGTDAAPFHRVFNPGIQQERFDPDGGYVRRYLEELADPPYSRQPGSVCPRPRVPTPNPSSTTLTSGAKRWRGMTRRADLPPSRVVRWRGDLTGNGYAQRKPAACQAVHGPGAGSRYQRNIGQGRSGCRMA